SCGTKTTIRWPTGSTRWTATGRPRLLPGGRPRRPGARRLMSASETASGVAARPAGPRPSRGWRSVGRPVVVAVQVLLVRLRFLLLLAGMLALVAAWPILRNYFDKFTRPAATEGGAVSLDTEYWCPMCPGVVSEWPSKCPVCNMALVRRKKGEATPLPDGVLARMQFSPYRIQLAGIRTAAVEYRPLRREVT